MSGSARGYLRFPRLHGQLVASTAQDDVWLAPLDGASNRPPRLTDDRAPVADVAISPDARTVAHTSTVDGVPEAHVVAAEVGATPPGVATRPSRRPPPLPPRPAFPPARGGRP